MPPKFVPNVSAARRRIVLKDDSDDDIAATAGGPPKVGSSTAKDTTTEASSSTSSTTATSSEISDSPAVVSTEEKPSGRKASIDMDIDKKESITSPTKPKSRARQPVVVDDDLMEDITSTATPSDDDRSTQGEVDQEPDYADEGDELVKEIPVYLSQRLADYLYLFQYPVRSSELPYTPTTGPSKARIKPRSQLIELDLPVDTRATQYSQERGAELAFGTNDKPIRTALDSNPDMEYDDNPELLDKQTLVSTLVPNATNYLAGVFRNDEMHLTPFHGMVQLRPSFKYLDKIDEKKRQANKKVHDEDNKELVAKQKADSEAKAKALQVQVRSAADTDARKVSQISKARLAEEEPWTKLDYFNELTVEADVIYDRMFANFVDELESTTTIQDYLQQVSSNNSLQALAEVKRQ